MRWAVTMPTSYAIFETLKNAMMIITHKYFGISERVQPLWSMILTNIPNTHTHTHEHSPRLLLLQFQWMNADGLLRVFWVIFCVRWLKVRKIHEMRECGIWNGAMDLNRIHMAVPEMNEEGILKTTIIIYAFAFQFHWGLDSRARLTSRSCCLIAHFQLPVPQLSPVLAKVFVYIH